MKECGDKVLVYIKNIGDRIAYLLYFSSILFTYNSYYNKLTNNFINPFCKGFS